MHLESREELIEEEDEMIKFMSGLEGYIDQIEIDAAEERRAKKLRDRQRIQTVSSDDDDDETSTDDGDDSDEWEDFSEDSDDSEFNKIFRRYVVNQRYDSDDYGVDENGRTFYVHNGYRMYSDGEYDYEYDRDVYWD